jgi:OOP family OmpA-OmpF porin
MRRDITIAHAAMLAGWLVAGTASGATAPKEPGVDHPLVGRYAGSTMTDYQSKRFDSRSFVTGGTPDRSLVAENVQSLEGKSTVLVYQSADGVSSLEVFRNFQASLKSRGFVESYVCENNEGQPKRCPDAKQIAYRLVPMSPTVVEYRQCFRVNRYALFRKGNEATIGLLVGECLGQNPPTRIFVSVLESATMATDQIIVPSASDIRSAFTSEGKIALYGIYFDTGRADLKPESKPTVDAIVNLLEGDPKLSLIITGYTDNAGDFAANVALSKRRAESVVAALVTRKIAAGRLTAFGAGMTSPRAPNTEESGRAKNRRVELVPR